MVRYKKLYFDMVYAVDRAITLIGKQDYGSARELLLTALLESEQAYVQSGAQEKTQPTADSGEME